MKINIELLKELEKNINTKNPENGEVPIKILGFGEISLVFELVNDPENLAYKRLPIFKNKEQAQKHEVIFKEYNRLLTEELNIITPVSDVVWFESDKGKIIFYSVQEKILPESVGNKVIHQIDEKDVELLVLHAMREMKKVWSYNIEHEDLEVGFDAQISNFAVVDYDPENPKVDESSKLLYIDTVPPFYRVNGEEAMNMELLANAIPIPFRGILKSFFMQDIIDGYYDWKTTTVDLIANFYKEQKPEIVPKLIEVINNFFEREAKEFNIETVTLKEVEKYYKTDKSIYKLLQGVRRFDRFIKTKILRKKYDYFIPEKIKR